MAATKRTKKETNIKITASQSVKIMIVDCLRRKEAAAAEIKKQTELQQIADHKLNAVMIAFMEGNGHLLPDYSIVEYAEDGSYIVVSKNGSAEETKDNAGN